MSKSLQRLQGASWVTVIASIIGLSASRHSNPMIILALFFALLCSLALALWSSVRLRKSPQVRSHRIGMYWRVAFLAALTGVDCYLWIKSGAWECVLVAALCVASAVLLWRLSPRSRFPLYALTFTVVAGLLNAVVSHFAQDAATHKLPMMNQAFFVFFAALPCIWLIECCIFARRLGRDQ